MTVAVTLALGSTLATVLVSEQISLARGIAAFVVLLSLQYAISWLSVRSRRVQELVRGEAALLFHGGEFLDGALRRERVTPDEVRSAARDAGLDAGLSTLADVEAAVLETDGSIAVQQGGRSRLRRRRALRRRLTPRTPRISPFTKEAPCASTCPRRGRRCSGC